ncbi:class I SAM-dependent methyltransferase [Kangiella marina]|uniref:SAM-dependent methyltransferase n=1 Tax=Kangiella marina TaxID=1079178 RepID=A0ABP8IG79_9GAMM
MSVEPAALPDFCRNFDDYLKLLEQQSRALEVPAPESAAAEISFQLAQKIAEYIYFKGKMPFSEFMHQALYSPGLGYYSAGSHKLGAAGDFVTAPEISPMFGQTIAKSLQQAWRSTEPKVLELGAGSGKLMCDILKQCQQDKMLPDTYYILEVSADLKQRQQRLLNERLPELSTKVVWLDRLPKNFEGVVLANEVADAIPVELLMQTEQGLTQGFVGQTEQGFKLEFQVNDFSQGWQKRHANVCADWREGYLAESCEHRRDWLKGLLAEVEQGIVLLIDYGFEEEELYSPYRPQGSLQCYYRQKKHSMPLALLGLQDITSSVNFTQLAQTALDSDAVVLGFTTQAEFLTQSGIEQFVAQVEDSDTMSSLSVAQQLQTLLMPNEMGQSIKVLGLSKNFNGSLSGFASLGMNKV